MSKSGPKRTPINDSNTGPKTTPTNHGPREKQSEKEQRSPHQLIKIKIFRTRLQAGIIEFSTTFENCTKVKTDVEIRRLVQQEGRPKIAALVKELAPWMLVACSDLSTVVL